MSEVIITGRSSGGSKGNGIPTSICRNLRIIYEGTSVSLKWQDPNDTIVDGQYLASWAGTKIVKKLGSYPKDEKDGTLVVDSNLWRNQYNESAYIDTIVEGEDWKYAAFPYTTNGVYCYNDLNAFQKGVIYGYRIHKTDSNPATRVSYITDCANESFTPAKMNYTTGVFEYGDWENAFFMPKPCMLKYDGTVDYYLNPNNFALKEDGTASDISNSGYGGNVMIEFPQVWIKYVNNGDYQEFYISNQQIDNTYHCYTHYNKDNQLIPYCYVSAYDGANVSSRIRSLAGLTPVNTQTAATEITWATANGAYWYTGVLADWLMLQTLLTLIGRSTDMQTTFGNGYYTGGSQASHLRASGTTKDKGMFYGTTGTESVKVFGIENLWGNIWKRIGGWINANGTQKIKLTQGTIDGSTATNYNTDGAGYISIGTTPAGTSGGYISEAVLTEYGLFPKTASGSQTTYFCDGFWFNNGQVDYALVGGACADGFLVGGFYAFLGALASFADWYFGAALSCKPPLN